MKKLFTFLIIIALSFQSSLFNMNILAESDYTGEIRTIPLNVADQKAVEILHGMPIHAVVDMTEGEQIQLILQDDSDLPEIDYITFVSDEYKAAISNDLILAGFSAGEDIVTLYIWYNNSDRVDDLNIKVNIQRNEMIPAAKRNEIEELGKYRVEGFLRRKIELSGALNQNAKRLTLEQVKESICNSDRFQTIYRQCTLQHEFPDMIPNDSGNTHYLYWLDNKGNEYIDFIMEDEIICYYMVNDDGTEMESQILYPESIATDPKKWDISDIYHYYKVFNSIPHEFETFVRGDINDNGVFNALDASVLRNRLSHQSEQQSLSQTKWELADMNQDRKLNAIDLTIMKRELLYK